MKYGARNRIQAKVKSVKSGDVMSLVKFDVTIPQTRLCELGRGDKKRIFDGVFCIRYKGCSTGTSDS